MESPRIADREVFRASAAYGTLRRCRRHVGRLMIDVSLLLWIVVPPCLLAKSSFTMHQGGGWGLEPCRTGLAGVEEEACHEIHLGP